MLLSLSSDEDALAIVSSSSGQTQRDMVRLRNFVKSDFVSRVNGVNGVGGGGVGLGVDAGVGGRGVFGVGLGVFGVGLGVFGVGLGVFGVGFGAFGVGCVTVTV